MAALSLALMEPALAVERLDRLAEVLDQQRGSGMTHVLLDECAHHDGFLGIGSMRLAVASDSYTTLPIGHP